MLPKLFLDKKDKPWCTSHFFIVTYLIATKKCFWYHYSYSRHPRIQGVRYALSYGKFISFICATAEVSIDLLPKVVALFFHFSSIIWRFLRFFSTKIVRHAIDPPPMAWYATLGVLMANRRQWNFQKNAKHHLIHSVMWPIFLLKLPHIPFI